MKKRMFVLLLLLLTSACKNKSDEPVITETKPITVSNETSNAETTFIINEEFTVSSKEYDTTVTDDSMTEVPVSIDQTTDINNEMIADTTIISTSVSDVSEVTSEIEVTETPKPIKKTYSVLDKNWNIANMFKCGLVPVCTLTEPNDWGYRQPDKYGYADKKGNIIIEPVWDIAWEFSDIGIAVVGKSVGEYKFKYGFIDTKGNIIVEPQFDDVVSPYAMDNMQQITAFNDGCIAVVRRNENYDHSDTTSGIYDNNDKLYFVDPNGQRITNDYDVFWGHHAPEGGVFNNGYAGVVTKVEKGKYVTDIWGVKGRNGYIDSYKYGFIDTNGQYVYELSCQFSDVSDYLETGSAASYIVSDVNKNGYVIMNSLDTTGSRLINIISGKELSFEKYEDKFQPEDLYYDGSVSGYYLDGTTCKYFMANNMGKTLLSSNGYFKQINDKYIAVGDDGKIGIMNTKCKYVFTPQFDGVLQNRWFKDVLCFAWIGESLYVIKEDFTSYLLSEKCKFDFLESSVGYNDRIGMKDNIIDLLMNGYSYSYKVEDYNDMKDVLMCSIFNGNDLVYSGRMPTVFADGYIWTWDREMYDKNGLIPIPENYQVCPAVYRY